MAGSKQTIKTYYERINVVLQYIENHLGDTLDLDVLAGLSFYSPFHFHRIMRAYLGESLGGYIQRVRVSTAAQLLRYTDLPISEIANRVGYDTPAAFNKVFRKRYGFAPGNFRKRKALNVPINNIKKQRIAMKNLTLQPEIRSIKDFKVIYVTAIGAYGDHNTDQAWRAISSFAGRHRLFGKSTQFLGISYDDPKFTEHTRCRYEACLTVGSDIKPEGKVGFKVVPGGKFAVFRLIGSYDLLAASYDYIYGEWVIKNNIDLDDRPGFEKYLTSPDVPVDKKETEIWISVK